MKLSDYTKKILENFVSINNSIVVKATGTGPTTIRTINRTKNMQAETTVPETLPYVSLHDMGQFLQVLSGMNDPEVEFSEQSVTVKDNSGSSVKILYADPSVIIQPPDKSFPKKDITLKFDLSQNSLSQILSMGKILNLPDLRVFNNNGDITLQALDKKNPNSNTNDVVVGKTDANKAFEYWMDITLFKMIPGDYTVEIGLAAWFTNKANSELIYLLALKK